MNLLKPLLPFIRVWLYGQIVWALSLINLPAEHAVALTDWMMGGIPLIVTVAYGAWASWRDRKLKLMAGKVDEPTVTTR